MKSMSGIFLAAMSMAVFSLSGCVTKSEPQTGQGESESHEEGHDHGHAHHHHAHGPHDGELIELGEEEYHAEWLVDEDTDKVTLYLLGPDAKEAVWIPAESVTINVSGLNEPKQYELTAADANDEGMASTFELADPELPIHLRASGADEEGVQAALQVEIDGTPYTGKFVPHEHH